MSSALSRRRSRGPGWTVSMASAQAHLLPDLGHGRLGDRPDAFRAGGQDLVQARRSGHQLGIALAGPSVTGDDPSGEDLLHVNAAGPCRSLAVPQLLVILAEVGLELADVADLGPARVAPQDPPGVGDHRHDLLADDLLGREDVDGIADRLAHLPDAVGAEDDRRLGVDRLRLRERVAVARVERAHDLA